MSETLGPLIQGLTRRLPKSPRPSCARHKPGKPSGRRSMQCRLAMWMLVCATLSLSNCTTIPTDSFCQVYRKIITEKGDGSITAPIGVKKRILANELTYREQCSK